MSGNSPRLLATVVMMCFSCQNNMTSHTRVVKEADVHSQGGDIDMSDAQISEAVAAVRDGAVGSWCILGYQGNTSSIKVVESGQGFEDLLEELSDGKIHYVYWKATAQGKFVYICWVGEGVPVTRKGLVNNHGHVVGKQVMQHFHVQINARGRDDLDEDSIMKKIKSAGGADYDAGDSRGIVKQSA